MTSKHHRRGCDGALHPPKMRRSNDNPITSTMTGRNGVRWARAVETGRPDRDERSENSHFMGKTLRILVVEDDFLIAEQLAFEIRQLGDEIVGPFGTIAGAADSLARADAAILDVRLRGGTSFALADRLAAARVPFLFLTGYDTPYVPDRFGGRRLYNKSSPTRILLAELRIQSIRATNEPTLEDVVVEMMARARSIMPDEKAAERLVEAVLISTIARVEAGERMADIQAWLLTRLTRECTLRLHIHMH